MVEGTEGALAVVDTNVLLNLATPVVDGRSVAPSGNDPLKAVLTAYDVHVPSSVLGELSDAASDDDLLATAADAVLRASGHLTTHDVDGELTDPLEYGLDRGESHGIRLANHLDAAMFVTDEFNSTNYLLVALALADRNTLFTTPHVLCVLAVHGVLDRRYVDAALTYYVDTKGWDREYVDRLRAKLLD
jgi:predicted ribonuclease YlaK